MLCRFLFLLLLGLALCPALEFKIDSPDKGEVWPKSSLVNKTLRWKESKKLFIAEVTLSDGNYSGGGSNGQETFEFVLPGITYEQANKIFYATAPTGEKVPIAQKTEQLIGSRIDLYKTATIHVSRFRTEMTLSLSVNTAPTPEPEAKVNADGTIQVPIDSVLRH